MPEQQVTRQKNGKKDDPPKLVEYVVLRLLPIKPGSNVATIFGVEDENEAVLEAIHAGVWVPVMQKKGEKWMPRRVGAPSQERAIEIVTGKAEEALRGTWRAVSWSAWKGATTVQPPRQVMLDVRALVEEG